jgi:hypothetical protein
MKLSRIPILMVVLMFAPAMWADTLVNEGFDSIATLPANGWAQINNSVPPGTTGWFQGNAGVFAAYEGAEDSYIAANFENADISGGNISDWLLTPEVELDDRIIITFYTRTESGSEFPDSLELRFSTNGASTNVGTDDTSFGDFDHLLLTINPDLAFSGYPEEWTKISAEISGLPIGSTGRFAFRYLVSDTTINGDYIGIDSVNVSQVPEPASLALVGSGIALLAFSRRRFRF